MMQSRTQHGAASHSTHSAALSSLQGYVVLDRPYAFKQWVEKYLDTIPGGWRCTCCLKLL
jgi:hypothetical protein